MGSAGILPAVFGILPNTLQQSLRACPRTPGSMAQERHLDFPSDPNFPLATSDPFCQIRVGRQSQVDPDPTSKDLTNRG